MTQVARTYGQSLYELARDEGLDGQILPQLAVVSQIFRENPDYVRLLSLPSLSKQERCAIVADGLGGQIHGYLLNFLKILVENGTVDQFSGCEARFRALHHEHHGILEVTAITATTLNESLREKLLEKLTRITGKKVALTCRVDASVLGGVRLEMDGKRLDGTVETQLKELGHRLTNAAL